MFRKRQGAALKELWSSLCVCGGAGGGSNGVFARACETAACCVHSTRCIPHMHAMPPHCPSGLHSQTRYGWPVLLLPVCDVLSLDLLSLMLSLCLQSVSVMPALLAANDCTHPTLLSCAHTIVCTQSHPINSRMFAHTTVHPHRRDFTLGMRDVSHVKCMHGLLG